MNAAGGSKSPSYRDLLRFRLALRHFVAWSRIQTASAGLTPTQHLLLLIVQGHEGERGPTVGEIAAALALRHHSAVGLVDRAEQAGFVKRHSPIRSRSVHVRLTPRGSRALEKVTLANLEELRRLRPQLMSLLDEL